MVKEEWILTPKERVIFDTWYRRREGLRRLAEVLADMLYANNITSEELGSRLEARLKVNHKLLHIDNVTGKITIVGEEKKPLNIESLALREARQGMFSVF